MISLYFGCGCPFKYDNNITITRVMSTVCFNTYGPLIYLLHFFAMSCELIFLVSDTAGIAYSNALFSAGSGPIYLTDVSCTSSKTSLLQCNSDPILSGGCSHSEDAGVKCEGLASDSLSQDSVNVD